MYDLTCDKGVQILLPTHLPHDRVLSATAHKCCLERWREMIPALHSASRAFAKPSGIPTGPVSFPQPSCSPSIQTNSKNLVRNKPSHPSRLRADQSSSAGKDLGVLVGRELSNISNVSVWPRRPMAAWAALGRALPTSKGGAAPVGKSGALCSMVGSSVQEKPGALGMGPAQEPQR